MSTPNDNNGTPSKRTRNEESVSQPRAPITPSRRSQQTPSQQTRTPSRNRKLTTIDPNLCIETFLKFVSYA